MKKIYPSFSILICLSFLFTLNSCTSDTPFESEDSSGQAAAKNEIHNFKSSNADAVHANIMNPHISGRYAHNDLIVVPYVQDGFAESISTYAAQAEANKTVDPDWKNLVTHFIEVTDSIE